MYHIQVPKKTAPIQLSKPKSPIARTTTQGTIADKNTPWRPEFRSIFTLQWGSLKQTHKKVNLDVCATTVVQGMFKADSGARLKDVPPRTQGSEASSEVTGTHLKENILNVVGENHLKSESRRSQEEEYTKEHTNFGEYWLEEELTDSNGDPVDKFEGRLLHNLKAIDDLTVIPMNLILEKIKTTKLSSDQNALKDFLYAQFDQMKEGRWFFQSLYKEIFWYLDKYGQELPYFMKTAYLYMYKKAQKINDYWPITINSLFNLVGNNFPKIMTRDFLDKKKFFFDYPIPQAKKIKTSEAIKRATEYVNSFKEIVIYLKFNLKHTFGVDIDTISEP